MKHSIEDLKILNTANEIALLAWRVYNQIPAKQKDTAIQFIRSADSIGANIAEGHGRGSFKDRKHFLIIARGSLRECTYWIQLLKSRNLVEECLFNSLIDLLNLESRMIMGYINYLQKKISTSP